MGADLGPPLIERVLVMEKGQAKISDPSDFLKKFNVVQLSL